MNNCLKKKQIIIWLGKNEMQKIRLNIPQCNLSYNSSNFWALKTKVFWLSQD